jgi:hypothetical protein
VGITKFVAQAAAGLLMQKELEYLGRVITNTAHPFVAHAPTMRVPMNIQGTDHIYLALWASLTAVHRHNRVEARQIKTLACPGLARISHTPCKKASF